MITIDEAATLALCSFSRPRVGLALRTWYPREPPADVTGLAGDTAAPLPGPGAGPPAVVPGGTGLPPLDEMFEWLAGPAEAPAVLARARAEAARALDAARAAGIEAIGWGDLRYPPLLAAIPDPPPVLWLRGRPPALAGPLVAIVGSRVASAYGLAVAERLASDLASCGFGVVSGLARGADAAAHRGSLAARGVTIAVLGSGPDVIYPPEHGRLARDILVSGALVSEFPPGTAPRRLHFPMRNRLISGLAVGVVVIEASEQSGSLITAGCALEQGREVMAVPGSALNGRNRGAHALIKNGAALVEEAEDVLAALGVWALPARAPAAGEEDRDPILAVMQTGDAYHVDQLSHLAGLEPARLLARLLELELRGAVARDGAGRFVRSARSC
jgi:DNA processing protein